MEKKLKHLELVQGVINRMASNSFLLKGWTVLLVSALFALATGELKIQYIYLAYFPSVAFWILDGYFLRQERLFRKLYDKVRTLPESEIDFSMDTSPFSSQVQSWPRTLVSRTLLIFHGAIILTISVIALLSR